MSRSRITSLLAAQLGLTTHAAGLVTARTFRSISVTHHRVREGHWDWAPPGSTDTHVAVLFPADGTPVPTAESRDDGAAPIGLFLPSTIERSLEWDPSAELLAVWVPELLLQEFTGSNIPTAVTLYSSPLTIGFRTFAHAVARHVGEGSSMSKYAIERLLTEMTFGSLIEQQSVESGQRPSSLVERARSVILVHRENPEFSTTQLATELHISARQLQRAFSQVGTTPGDLLRRMRVELAESMLRNPLYAALTVDEVSRYSGFASALQLRRALRAEGAPAPTTMRRASAD
jgi:AraC-like DNA-binding protein